METTEKIVESYCRYIKGWATIPNIKCPGQLEIDLLAIDPKSGERFHVESGVSISGGFSKLTARAYDENEHKVRTKAAQQRRTFGYFYKKKFSSAGVVEMLRRYGFHGDNYKKIIVTWDWESEAKKEADNNGIELWDFRLLMKEIAEKYRNEKTYFTDDTMRTIQLLAKALGESAKSKKL